MTCIGKTFPLYFFVFITINDRLNIFFLYLFTCSGYPYPHVMYTIQFYDHLIFLQISLIIVINRCWFIITSKFDNFPLRSVWNTSSVSIVYEQPSALVPARLKSSVKTNSAGLFYIKLYYQYQHSGKTLSLNLLCRQRDLCSYYVFSRVSKSINLRIS